MQAYGAESVREGKDAARRELRRRLGLSDTNVPIIGCVTRLVAQKVRKRSEAPHDWLRGPEARGGSKRAGCALPCRCNIGNFYCRTAVRSLKNVLGLAAV